jgi:Pyruvate/2-oxoacid:ferredoxin oxidoreductase delta subunit
MIYYFSGTGNSKWVAGRLAALTDDRAENIADLQKVSPAEVIPAAGEPVGLVFPIYAWGAPRIVERFCKLLRIDGGSFAYAVCTCGDEAGNAMKRLKKVFPWQSAFSIAMPNNYIPMYDVDSEALAKGKAQKAEAQMQKIALSLRQKERIYSVHAGSMAGLKTSVISPMFNAFARSTKPFTAGDDCTSCNLCQKICPASAISMQNGKPAWVKKHCTQCMACISRCPQSCIQYGTGTKGRGRYVFSEKLLEND